MKQKCKKCENLKCMYSKFGIWSNKKLNKQRNQYNDCKFYIENFQNWLKQFR